MARRTPRGAASQDVATCKIHGSPPGSVVKQVLRFSCDTIPAEGIHKGKIEHISSGRTMQFTSLAMVEEFVTMVITEEPLNDRHRRD